MCFTPSWAEWAMIFFSKNIFFWYTLYWWKKYSYEKWSIVPWTAPLSPVLLFNHRKPTQNLIWNTYVGIYFEWKSSNIYSTVNKGHSFCGRRKKIFDEKDIKCMYVCLSLKLHQHIALCQHLQKLSTYAVEGKIWMKTRPNFNRKFVIRNVSLSK